jgi:polyhydroxybutyrate depolymerase
MSAWNACKNADQFAAVASVAGMGFGMHLLGCNAARPVPLIAINATDDTTPDSSHTVSRWEMDRWAEQAQCNAEPERESIGGDHCDHWKECAGDVELTHCTTATSEHCWFGSEASCDGPPSDLIATDLIWEFFARFSLPVDASETGQTGAPDGGLQGPPDAAGEHVARLDPATEPEGCRAASIDPGTELSVELTHGGARRRYLLHVPADLDPSLPAPLVFDYHGAGSAPELEAADSQMSSKADEEGFIVVYPEGVGAMFNAGSCCSLFGGAEPPHLEDDAGFTRAILNDVAGKLCIDLRRVYSTGASNGGFMSEWNACKNADIFAAVAPIVGMGAAQPDCTPSRPIPMIAFGFTEDPYVDYGTSTWEWGVWVDERNRCTDAPERESFGEGFCDHWRSCADDVEMVRCTIDGADHCWPGGGVFCPGAAPASFARDRVWDFMSRFTLPLD